jgi:hypothetical protein
MMIVPFSTNTTGATSGAGTACPSAAHEFTPILSRVLVAQSSVFCVVLWRSSFVILSLVFWPLHCLSFLELRLLFYLQPFLNNNVMLSLCLWLNGEGEGLGENFANWIVKQANFVSRFENQLLNFWIYTCIEQLIKTQSPYLNHMIAA